MATVRPFRAVRPAQKYADKVEMCIRDRAYVKEQMVMYDIAEKEDLSYTDEEEDELRTQLEDAGYQDDETFVETFGQDMDTYIELALTFNKVGEFIYDNAKVAGEETESTQETQSEQTTRCV